MAERITTTELTRSPGKYIDIAMGGTAVHLTRHGRIVAILTRASEHPIGIGIELEASQPAVESVAMAEVQADATDASAPSRRPPPKSEPQRAIAQPFRPAPKPRAKGR